VLKASSPPPMVLSEGIWPSGWMPCSCGAGKGGRQDVRGCMRQEEGDGEEVVARWRVGWASWDRVICKA
jgi:hypothetical protein